MGGFDFSAFFFRINTIRGTVFLELFGPRSLPGVGRSFWGPEDKSLEIRAAHDEGGIEAFRSPESRRERLTANRREMVPQCLEKIESAPGNGMGSEASNLQHLVHGRAAGGGSPGVAKWTEKGT
jgi:hypothetical protein